jgi:predicted RNA methylase
MLSDPKSFAGRPANKADLLGQVFTPNDIAMQMANILLKDRSSKAVSVLDPCVGPFSFPEALAQKGLISDEDFITLIDVDEEMIKESEERASKYHLKVNFRTIDYLSAELGYNYDYAILNPPYTRQEWIDRKHEYRSIFKARYNIDVPGTSNLYVYFLVKVIMDLKIGGQFIAIVYDSWKSTRYGQWLLKFMNAKCNALQVTEVKKQPFHDRLIDATIIQGVKGDSKADLCIRIREVNESASFADINGFATVDSVLRTKRGLRLKQANFFMCDLQESETMGATPFIKKVNSIKGFIVPENHSEAALLIHPGEVNPLARAEVNKRIQDAQGNPADNLSVLTWFKARPDDWYTHRKTEWYPIIFNYYLRNRPRHIYNPTRVFSDNFYGIAPRQEGSIFSWLAVLNSTATCVEILRNARTQGNGLFKIQLFEYRQVHVANISRCDALTQNALDRLGRQLVNSPESREYILSEIDSVLYGAFSDHRLNPTRLRQEYMRFIESER